MRKSRFLASLALAAIGAALGGASLSAQTMSGPEVMARHFRLGQPKTAVISMTMTITKNGKALNRSMQTYAAGDNAKGETENKLIKFLAPGDIKGSGFLTFKKVDGATESQLWLPAMGKVRRLSSGASDQDQAFFGSDFTNRDISGYSEGDFTYKLLSSDAAAYQVEATPKSAMSFTRLVYSIDAKSFTSSRIEYWKDAKLIKTQTMTWENIKGYFVLAESSMVSTSGSNTVIKMTDVKLDTPFAADTFTERFLRQ